jgi:hypothetical protein
LTRGLAATVAGSLVLASALLAGGPVAGAAPAADVPPALADWGGCLSSEGTGDLLLLIDKSGSLSDGWNRPGTDPLDVRTVAANYLVRQLAAQSGDTNRRNVAVSTFSVDFELVLGWQPLNGGSLPGVQAVIDSLKDEDDGWETDYWTALEGARRTLAERAQAGAKCQAIAWFSDGQIDIVAKADSGVQSKPYAEGNGLATQADLDAAIAAAKDSICRAQGLADGLRAAGVKLFAFGLLGPAGSNTAADFDFMRGVATGGDCGAITDPAPGHFWLAEDVDSMIIDFDTIADPESPPITQPGAVCQGEVCAEGRHSVVLDDSVDAVSVLGMAPVDGLDVILIDPSGAQTPLTRGAVGQAQSADLKSARATWTWLTKRTVEIGLTRQGAGWQGEWVIVFVDPASSSAGAMSRTQVRVSGGLAPTWNVPDDLIYVGDSIEGTTLGLLNSKGEPVDAAKLLGQATVMVELLDHDRQAHLVANVDKTEVGDPFDIDLMGIRQGKIGLRLTLYLTTAGVKDAAGAVTVPGTEFAPSIVEYQIEILPPLDFPQAGPTVNFGTLDDAKALWADAVLATVGQGCVWFDPGSVTVLAAPEDVSPAIGSPATSADTCVHSTGAGGELPLTLTVDRLGNGALSGTFDVFLAPEGEPDRAIVQTVSYTADLRKPINEGRRWAIFIACLIAGPLLPLLGLWVMKALGAKIPGQSLVAKTFPVKVTAGGVTGVPQPLGPNDLADVAMGNGRSVTAGALSLRTKVGLSPFGNAQVVVDSPGQYGASGGMSEAVRRPVGDDHHAVLPLAVHGNWVMLVTPGAPEGEASLTFLASGSADQAQLGALFEKADLEAHRVYTELRDLAPKDEAPAAPVGGPTGAGGDSAWQTRGGTAAAPQVGSIWDQPTGPAPAPGGGIWDQPTAPGPAPGGGIWDQPAGPGPTPGGGIWGAPGGPGQQPPPPPAGGGIWG